MTGLSRQDMDDVYRRCAPALLRRCRRILKNEAAAHDAVHLAFLRAWSARTRFRSTSQPATWLTTIATRVCFDLIDRRRRFAEVELSAAAEPTVEPDHEARLDVGRCLERCPPSTQRLIRSRYFEGLEVQEIARDSGWSQRTVARRLADFLRDSRVLLEGPDG